MISKEKQDKIFELRNNGMKISDISESLGVSERTVGDWCRKFGLTKSIDKDSRFTDFIKIISTYAGDDWEYDTGFVSTHHPVVLRCKHCGNAQVFNADAIRQWKKPGHSHGSCDACSAIKEAQIEYAKASVLYHDCPVCGKSFYGFSTCCSDKCNDEMLANRRKDRFVSTEKTCKNCGKHFMTEFKKNKTFCSEHCRDEYVKSYRHFHKRIRKKKLADAIVDDNITLEGVCRKFNGVCQICGHLVNYNDYTTNYDGYFITGHDYPSIDHIVPLSKGGKHSWDNVQLAHFMCNSMKSDTLSDAYGNVSKTQGA